MGWSQSRRLVLWRVCLQKCLAGCISETLLSGTLLIQPARSFAARLDREDVKVLGRVTTTSAAQYRSAMAAIMQCMLLPACPMRAVRPLLLLPCCAKLHSGIPALNSALIGKAWAVNASEAVSQRLWKSLLGYGQGQQQDSKTYAT